MLERDDTAISFSTQIPFTDDFGTDVIVSPMKTGFGNGLVKSGYQG
jgi:hypothetical protein